MKLVRERQQEQPQKQHRRRHSCFLLRNHTRLGRILGCAQVSRYRVLVGREYHHFIQQVISATVLSFFSIVRSSETTFSVKRPFFASTFLSCRLMVPTGVGCFSFCSVNS